MVRHHSNFLVVRNACSVASFVAAFLIVELIGIARVEAAPPAETYRIQTVKSGRYLRIRTEGDKKLCTVDTNRERFPDDRSTQFSIEALPDGSYRIKSVATGSYLYADPQDKLISTRRQVGATTAQLNFLPAGPRQYRLKFASENNYWHEDGLGDRLVATRWGTDDEYTLFRIMAANSTPSRPIPANLIDSSGKKPGGEIAAAGARRPVEANSQSRLPSIIPYVNADESLDIAWMTAAGETMLSRFTGQGWQNAQHTKIGNALPVLAGFTKDPQGNRYLMTATGEKVIPTMDEYRRRPNVLHILKVPANSSNAQLLVDLNQESHYGVWGIYNPLLVSPSNGRFSVKSQLVYGNGVLTASFAHNIPGDDGYVHDTMCILAVDSSGRSVYRDGGGMHCGDLQTIFDGQNFVQAQAHERGIVLSKLVRGSNSQMSWTDHKLVFKNDHHELLLGGLEKTSSGYLVVFSHPNWGVNPENGLPVWFVSLPRNFETLPTWRWPNKADVYSNQVSSFKLALPPQNAGRRDSYERPRVASFGNGRFAVCWEHLVNGRYQSTYAIVVDETGQALSGAKEIPEARIQNASNAFELPTSGRIGWISGDSTTATFKLITLDSNLNVNRASLSLQ